jgi:hypothetical protein
MAGPVVGQCKLAIRWHQADAALNIKQLKVSDLRGKQRDKQMDGTWR